MSQTAFVTGLSSRTSHIDVEDEFSFYGEVVSCTIPRGKRICFVKFAKEAEAKRAIERMDETQLCHAVSVIAQLPTSLGGNNGKVCYIDTENTFRPDRIQAISAHYNIDPNQVLDNILYARCYTSDHLVQLLVHVAAKMAEEKFALLIIDSIMGPFRVDFSGRGELAERQQILSKVMSRLQKLSEEFNIPVIITNQVMADPAAAMSFAANPPKPVGGHILAHFSTTRLALRKGRAEQRIMKIYDSPSLPEGDAVYEICERGIQDAKE